MAQDESAPKRGRTPLANLAGVSERYVQVLGARWFETAEQLLAVAGTAEGREGLRRLLAITEDDLNRLLALLVTAVGEGEAKQLMKAASERPLGAWIPPSEPKPPKA